MLELREEFSVFSKENIALASLAAADEIWLGKLAYMADMFNLLNQLNLSLNERDANVLLSQNKITAFIKKLNIRKTRINDYIVDMFPVLHGCIDNNPLINSELIFSDIQLELDRCIGMPIYISMI